MPSTLTTIEAEVAAIAAMRALIATGTVDRRSLNAVMANAFGGDDTGGTWTQRQRSELLEVAMLRALAGKPVTTTDDVRAVAQATAQLPAQRVRSEAQIDLQQFSTPADLAALVVLLAKPKADDIVLEPSAGHGALLAMLPSVAAIHANELDPQRRARLPASFPAATISAHDGAHIGSLLAGVPRPTLILMNPPFSRTGLGRDDALTAIGHLRAALSRLLPGGRLVAIMPDTFGPTGSSAELFARTFEGTTVLTSLRLEQAYRQHGTSIAVRLFVVDKVAGSRATPVTVARATVIDALEAVALYPRAKLEPSSTAKPRTTTVGLFRAARSTSVQPPRLFRAPLRNDVLPVAYAPLPTPASLGEQVGVYVPYRPSRVVFEHAGEHPTALVESVAMGAIPAPVPTYVPRLPERCVGDRLLSAAQLETPVYAGEAWSRDIEGRFKPDEEGVGLTLDDHGAVYRQGYFFGDGTGVGKGRQIAACILDQWLAGRRRHIWVTKNEALLDDARRDWTALGGLAPDLQILTRWKIDEPIVLDEGIILVTYPTLRSQRSDASRLDQLVQWAGPDFEGVIAFDEAHEMGGVAGGEGALGKKAGSLQGIAGVLLQNRLPRARVLYASATGASDVNNLAYAVRLGLWGPGTAFPDREAFIAQIRAGGIAAMELVARDLKATGRYVARALSFAGVEYEVLRHDLTPDQIAVYDTYADAWAIIHRNMEAALEATNVVDELDKSTLNAGAKAAARSRFESTKQRFFGQLLLSMKLPTVLAAVDGHLAAGQSVVLQLVTTAESILDRRLDELEPDARAELDIDLSPREYVIDYLERAFPTRQMRTFEDDTGKTLSAPLVDERGQPVHNETALEARAHLLEHVCALPPIKPALDAIIERYGTDAVAEVTGRTRRLVLDSQGEQQLEARSPRLAQADAALFMAGEKRILVFSDAGGTGRSYHASLDAGNQQQRVHLLLEPGWRADKAIQGLGRTHRTHQAATPLFRPVTTNCRGELRFISTIARRLDGLGALTRGQRQTGGQNLFDPADNLESEYAKAALGAWFRLLGQGKLQSTTLEEFQAMTGLELVDEDGVLKEDLPPIQRWLNRLLALRIGTQNAIFEEFLGLVDKRVAAARDAGRLDMGVETIRVERGRVVEDRVLRTDPASGATTHLLTLEIERKKTVTPLERVLTFAANDDRAWFARNAKSGKVGLVRPAASWLDEDAGGVVARVTVERPTRRDYHFQADLEETAWARCSRAEFERAWDAEAKAAAQLVDREVIRLATGLLLPIWSALPADHLEVNRIALADGRSWLGRLVFESDMAQLLTKLGLGDEATLDPATVGAAVRGGRSMTIHRPFEATLKRSRVNDGQRIELVGAPATWLPWLKAQGCFTEIIQYKTRVFVPVERVEALLAACMAC